jgi:hypothetical protein
MKKYSVTLRNGGCHRRLPAFLHQLRDGAEQPGCNPHQVICAAVSPGGCISQFTIRRRPTASKEISQSNKGDFGQFVSGCTIPIDGARLW